MTDQNDTLACILVAVILDDDLQELYKGLCRVSFPTGDREVGPSASGVVDCQTGGQVNKTAQQRVKLSDRSSKPMEENEQRQRRGVLGELLGFSMLAVEDSDPGIFEAAGAVRLKV